MLPWFLWIGLTGCLIGYLSYRLRSEDQQVFLPGKSTDGHYQIDLACSTCHTPLMGVKEESCIDCHGEDLTSSNDSHPQKKFTDPRNADQLKALDARRCVTCHIEHREHRTRSMGVTLADDYCIHCHHDIAQERPSHQGYAFLSCATAGCHNFHDNTALYEDFLAKHIDEPAFKPKPLLPQRELKERLLRTELTSFLKPRLNRMPNRTLSENPLPTEDYQDWLTNAHATAGIQCVDCHQSLDALSPTEWSDRVSSNRCQACHEPETKGWLQGKHGMRVAQGLSPMTPSQARLPMNSQANHQSLSCTSCHAAHQVDTRRAAVESCLQCHADEHSLNYKTSPHFAQWSLENSHTNTPSSGVSCATCHLPRILKKIDGKDWIHVEHNQNWNLQPNEKMIRSVCLHCHGLAFSIDALADPELIQNNFRGQPKRHIESIDLVKRRLMKTENEPTPNDQ